MNKNTEIEQFRDNAIKLIDYIVDYYKNIEEYPVKSQIKPGDIYSNFERTPPLESRNFDEILSDFDSKIMAGITHWQSPNFYAYFNANSSFPSLLGEFLTAALGVNVFSWETSPAGTELEQRVMEWLRDSIGLPNYFSGVIQDTASTATLVSLITAREKYSIFEINKNGFSKDYKFRIYCSSEAHSSIEKDVRIAGFGSENLIKIELNTDFSMNYNSLESRIIEDINNGFTPLAVISAIGTTGTTAIDNVNEIGKICKKYNVWHHIDAAHLGSALLLDEYRHWIDGIENCDTFVFNPHKWMFTNFDYSAYFVKDKESLTKTFDILPEYLKIKVDNDWMTSPIYYKNDKFGNKIEESSKHSSETTLEVSIEADLSTGDTQSNVSQNESEANLEKVTFEYKYDDKNRVIWSLRNGIGGTKIIYSYKYDDYGNVIEEIAYDDIDINKPLLKREYEYK